MKEKHELVLKQEDMEHEFRVLSTTLSFKAQMHKKNAELKTKEYQTELMQIDMLLYNAEYKLKELDLKIKLFFLES